MKPLKSGWIIRWNGTADDMPSEPIAVLNYRRTAKQVALVVGQMHLEHMATPGERLMYAKNQAANPYPAKIGRFEKISCGHNPWLEAEYVANIREVDGKILSEPRLSPERRETILRSLKVN